MRGRVCAAEVCNCCCSIIHKARRSLREASSGYWILDGVRKDISSLLCVDGKTGELPGFLPVFLFLHRRVRCLPAAGNAMRICTRNVAATAPGACYLAWVCS